MGREYARLEVVAGRGWARDETSRGRKQSTVWSGQERFSGYREESVRGREQVQGNSSQGEALGGSGYSERSSQGEKQVGGGSGHRVKAGRGRGDRVGIVL